MDNDDAITEVADELLKFQLILPGQRYSYTQLHKELAERLNYLITNDFSLLISVLYRVDISEKKLEQLLRQSNDTTAGDIIAEMIIERQLQKIASRKAFKNDPSDISEDDKW